MYVESEDSVIDLGLQPNREMTVMSTVTPAFGIGALSGA